MTQDRPINMWLLNKIPICQQTEWPPYSRVEINEAIIKYSSLSTLGLDYVSWNHFKEVVSNLKCVTNIVNIVNACINLSYWTSHFKKSTFIIILKSNKSLYDNPKIFWPIVLLNMLDKLIKKQLATDYKFTSLL